MNAQRTARNTYMSECLVSVLCETLGLALLLENET